MFSWLKITQELTIIVLWTIRDAEMALQRRNEGWAGREEIKRNAAVHVVRSHLAPPGTAGSQYLA